MSNRKIIVWVIIAFMVLLFLKPISLIGAILALIAIAYFGIKAIADDDNRKNILKKRVLPSALIALLCIFVNTSMNKPSATTTHSASSAKASSSSSKKDESSKDENASTDDESDSDSSDDYDNSSNNSNDDYDTSDEDSSTTTSNDNNETDTDTAKGDMETDQQGTIVGNSRTMVYHTPNQQGYRMNSANAVYFNTEAEAQAAGYRKSAR